MAVEHGIEPAFVNHYTGGWIEMDETTGHPGADAPHDFCLIIGAMKSGTTSLFELLAQHPQVCTSREKEPSFFCYPEQVAGGWDPYLKLWDWAPDRHRIALEASTQYAKAPWYPDVPGRIASFEGGSFRFIYMLRHPLRRIESQVRHALFEGWGRDLDHGISEDVVDYTRYAMQLDEFMAHFPRESVMVIVLEEFQRDPGAVLGRVCRFLGVADDFEFTDAGRKRNSGDYFEIPSTLANVAQTGLVTRIVHAMPPRLKRELREALAAFGRRRTAAKGDDASGSLGRWRLTDFEAAQVLETLRPDLRRLRGEYGVDFETYWDLGDGVP